MDNVLQEATDFRAMICERPLRPYDVIGFIPQEDSEKALKDYRQSRKYELANIDVDFNQPLDWRGEHRSRSERVRLQTWTHLEPLFMSVSANPNGSVAWEDLLAAIESWHAFAYAEPDALNPAREFDPNEDTFINYGLARSSRLYRIAYVVDVAARRPDVSHETFAMLIGSLASLANELSFDENFQPQHNHGLFMACAQIAATSRFYNIGVQSRIMNAGFGMEDVYWQGRNRLSTMVKKLIGNDGASLEHSVQYHLFITHILGWLVENEIEIDSQIRSTYTKMKTAAKWMIDLEGRPTNLGDTNLYPKLPKSRAMGTNKRASTLKTQLYPDAGFWFVKGRSKTQSTYLAQTCSFHSRFHKQADSGSVIWSENARDILVDAGCYGYVERTKAGTELFQDGFWYADTKRRYVESTRAHNTIEMDGQNQRRFRQKSLGGTITHGAQFGDVYASRCEIPNMGRVRHARTTILMPGQWLLVLDKVKVADGEDHDFKQWFHLHPDWTADQASSSDKTPSSEQSQFSNGDDKLFVTPLFEGHTISDPVRGQNHKPENALDPGHLGFWSPEAMAFEPCTSLAVQAQGQHIIMASLLSFEAPTVNQAFTAVNATHRNVRFQWQAASGQITVKLTDSISALGGEFDIDVRKK